MTSTDSPAFAAVVHRGADGTADLLARFAAKLKDDGIRVGGFVQEHVFGDNGAFWGIDAVDLATGQHMPIKRLPAPGKESNSCTLDTSALAGTSSVMRKAVADAVDLIVFEKFGGEEQHGRGLSDEIMEAITEGVPILVKVPADALEIWQERTGGLGAVLEADEAELAAWWRSLREEAA